MTPQSSILEQHNVFAAKKSNPPIEVGGAVRNSVQDILMNTESVDVVDIAEEVTFYDQDNEYINSTRKATERVNGQDSTATLVLMDLTDK